MQVAIVAEAENPGSKEHVEQKKHEVTANKDCSAFRNKFSLTLSFDYMNEMRNTYLCGISA
jgi:hypothetical protein